MSECASCGGPLQPFAVRCFKCGSSITPVQLPPQQQYSVPPPQVTGNQQLGHQLGQSVAGFRKSSGIFFWIAVFFFFAGIRALFVGSPPAGIIVLLIAFFAYRQGTKRQSN
jgi:hypothetical protein